MTATLTEPDWRAWPYGYAQRFYPGEWYPAPHQQILSAAIVRAIFGPKRKLIVSMPPRHAKSETTDLWTPVWYLDLFPHKQVMLVCYGQDLADEWSGKARDAIKENAAHLRVRVRGDSTAKKRWNTTRGGGMYAVGLNSTITGRGGSLIICDDLHKDWTEAQSALQREKVWNQYLGTVRTRLEPGPDGGPGAIIVPMTRWHEDDFAGKLQHHDPGGWEVLRLPALAEKDDPLDREEGEPLWPQRYPLDALESLAADLGAVGPHMFGAMFQQNPSAPAGTIFRREWWRSYESLPRGIEQWVGSWDMAFKDNEDSDFVVGQLWARKGADLYLVDQVRARMDFPTTRREVKDFAEKWPQCTVWIVEDKANGPAIISDLHNTVGGLIPFSPMDSKVARASAVSGRVASGNVYLPAFIWVQDFIDECAQFDNGVNDDQVDAFTQAALHLGVAAPLLRSRTYQDDRLAGRR